MGKRSSGIGASIFGFGLSLIIILWLYYKVDWQVVSEQLRAVNHLAFFPYTAIFILQAWLRALRWRYLLPRAEVLTTRGLFDGIMLSHFGNYVLPLRAGEFLRPLVVMRECKYSYPAVFVSVVLERFFDLSIVLLAFGAMLLTISHLPAEIHQGALALSVVAVGILGFIVLSTILPDEMGILVERLTALLPQKLRRFVRSILGDFLLGSHVLKDLRSLLMVLLLTLAIWLVTLYAFYALLIMLQIPASFEFALALTVIVALAVAAPSAPGFAGVYEAGSIVAFALFSLDRSTATTYALVGHIYQYVFVIGYGVWVIFRYGLRVSEIMGSRKSAQAYNEPAGNG